ncbi:MAG: hypothetical protein QOG54_2653 [Actinomycetota bacterium]|nr:hypothetical protein [Actinomycetota bacterium]
MAATRLLGFLPTRFGKHSDEAAAVAFLTGATLESAPAGGLIGAFAIGPLLSGSGHPAARLGAAGIGASIGLASTRMWPIPPELGPQAPKVWLPEHAEPNEDGAGLSIVVNVHSGDGDAPTAEIRAAFPKAEVMEVDVTDGDDIRKAFDEALNSGAIALGVCGGDGTVNTAAQVALDAKRALVVFPGGTFNHFTGALGIETIQDAAEAVKSGEAVGVDVATIAGQVFLNTASFGSYPELVDARERLERRFGKWPAVVIALIRVLRKSDPVEIEIDGQPKQIWMAFIGNCRYHPSGFAPSWRERLDDEQIDFRYVSAGHPFARTRLILAILTGRLGRSKVYVQTCVEKLELRSLEGSLRLARDGETFEGPEDIVVEKLEKRLAVYVPHSKKA